MSVMTIAKLQDYTPMDNIPGVKIISPTIHKDTGGELMEFFRANIYNTHPNGEGPDSLVIDSPALEWGAMQATYVKLHPGVVKAYHLHDHQSDLTFSLGKIIVSLIDMRGWSYEDPKLWGKETPSKASAKWAPYSYYRDQSYIRYLCSEAPKMRFIMDMQGVVIPPGVLHGYANPYYDDRIMIYYTSQHFNKLDEFRVPWDVMGGKEFEIEKG